MVFIRPIGYLLVCDRRKHRLSKQVQIVAIFDKARLPFRERGGINLISQLRRLDLVVDACQISPLRCESCIQKRIHGREYRACPGYVGECLRL